jgi:hypothetical protein
MPKDATPTFQPLTGIYEPSGIQQLPDGRFLVVEDEKRQPLSLVTLSATGSVRSVPLRPGPVEDDSFWKLDDLEAIALDRSGYLYALTSHSRDESGEEKKSRDKLVRFRIENDDVAEPLVFRGLKSALTAAHPELAAAAAVLDVKNEGGLNIEALEISPDRQQLLIGFRSPLLDRRAIIACIENPTGIFEAGEPPRIAAALVTLDLAGHGIRGMSYLPALKGNLLISGPVARDNIQFQLWFWSGRPDDAPRRVSVPGVAGFEHAEGVSPAVIDGRQRIIIVSDDGNRKTESFAHFLLLDPEQLRMSPT